VYSLVNNKRWEHQDAQYKYKNYQDRISEFCIELLVVDLLDWLQNAMRLEGHCLRLKRKRRSKMSAYPNFVAVLGFE
jgi:hypothetical protein